MGRQRIQQDWVTFTFTFTATSGQIIESWKLLSQKYWDYEYIDYVKRPQVFSCLYLFQSWKIFILFFNWRIIALQCCVSFCCTATWTSHNHTHTHTHSLSLSLNSPPSHPHPTQPLSVTAEHQAGLPVLYGSFPLVICFTHGSVYMSMLLSQFIPPSPSPCFHESVLYVCISTAALQMDSSVLSFLPGFWTWESSSAPTHLIHTPWHILISDRWANSYKFVKKVIWFWDKNSFWNTEGREIPDYSMCTNRLPPPFLLGS